MEIFNQPIKIKLCGNAILDNDAILQASLERDLKLFNLAIYYYNFDFNKPEDIIWLYNPLTLKLLEHHFSGLKYKLLKTTGRKKEKSPTYYLGLALAYEGSTYLSEDKPSKTEFAKKYAEYCIQLKKGKPLTIRDKKDINKLQAQIQNDLSVVGDPLIVSFIHIILKAIFVDGLSAVDVAQITDIKLIN